jgi:predicted nucleic acid-binding protein
MFEAAEARGARLVTTNLVVAETHRLLLFRAGPRVALHVLDRIHAHPRVTVEFATSELHQRAREWLVRLGDQAISYTDAMSFALMEATHIGVALTLDHDFSMAGFDIWRAQ